jgi:hypothetical protein
MKSSLARSLLDHFGRGVPASLCPSDNTVPEATSQQSRSRRHPPVIAFARHEGHNGEVIEELASVSMNPINVVTSTFQGSYDD